MNFFARIKSIRFGFQDALVLLCLYNLLAVAAHGFADDPGVGWHLQGGKYLFEKGIPRLDPFLHHSEPRSWISTQWLSDRVLWLLYESGSWPLLYAVLISIYALTFLRILYRGAAAVTGQYLLTTLLLIVPFKIGQIHFILRPVIFGFFLFALTTVTLAQIYERQARTNAPEQNDSVRSAWTLPPLFLLWANVHPHFVLGLALFCILLVGMCIDALAAGRALPRARLAFLLKILLLCVAATVATPYGIRLYGDILHHAQSAAVAVTQEFLPLRLASAEGRFVLFSFVVLFAGFLRMLCIRAPLRSYEILSVLAFGYGLFRGVRFAPFFAMVALIPLVRAAASLLEPLGALLRKSAPGVPELLKALERREAATSRGSGTLTLCCSLLIMSAVCAGRLPFMAAPLGPSRGAFPYAAIEHIERQMIRGEDVVVAAPLWWGGFLTLAGDGRIKPLIDDRASVNGDDAYRDYQRHMRPGAAWRDYLMRRGARLLLLPADDPLASEIEHSGALPLLFRDEVSKLFTVEP